MKIHFCRDGGFANFFETGGAGGNHYRGCKIQPGPRPPGATADEIVSCGADGPHQNNGDQGTIRVHGDGATGNGHIRIKDNVLDTGYGQAIFRIEDAENVWIGGNRVIHPFPFEPAKPGSILFLKQSTNVTLSGNEVSGQGLFAGELVHLDQGMRTTDVRNDGGKGIVVKDNRLPSHVR